MWQKMSVVESESEEDTAGSQPPRPREELGVGVPAGQGSALATGRPDPGRAQPRLKEAAEDRQAEGRHTEGTPEHAAPTGDGSPRPWGEQQVP